MFKNVYLQTYPPLVCGALTKDELLLMPCGRAADRSETSTQKLVRFLKQVTRWQVGFRVGMQKTGAKQLKRGGRTKDE